MNAIAALAYCLDNTCTLEFSGATATVHSPRGPLRITDLAPGQTAVLARLSGTPVTRDALVEIAAEDSTTPSAWVHMIIDRLVALGFLARTVPGVVRSIVTAPGYEPRVGSGDDDLLVLDRLAYLRTADGNLVLESPRAFSRGTILCERAAALLARAATPSTAGELIGSSGIDEPLAQAVVALLYEDGFLIAPEEQDGPLESTPWAEWSFHDALFHSRSRSGRHGYAYGATYSREGVRNPLPAVKPRPDGPIIELATVDLEDAAQSDLGFAAILERRQSWRRTGPRPLHVDELGEFLWRSARVRGRRGTEHEEVSNRPYPGGGADYELEIYVLAHRVEGLGQGLHYYDPLDHVLVGICEWTAEAEALARDVREKTEDQATPDAVLLVTARIHRLTYKYESIPYAVALKDLGSLYGTWYLTATAMGLAPCAIGGGDSEVLARATNIPSWVEPRIGEFILNTPDPTEVRGTLPRPRFERHRAVRRDDHV